MISILMENIMKKLLILQYCTFHFVRTLIMCLSIYFINALFLVITCDPIVWPLNGYVRCDKPEFIYGSKCSVYCFQGYEMVSNSTVEPNRIMCSKTSDNQPTLDKNVPLCHGKEGITVYQQRRDTCKCT